MSFTEDEKVRIRKHLGYLNVQEAQTFQHGFPAGVQTQFIIEGAMNRLLASAEAAVRDTLARLDEIEKGLFCNIDNVEVLAVDEMQMNPKAFEKRLQRYFFFQGTLANFFGTFPNPNDLRFVGLTGGGVNVPVIH